MKSLQNRLIKYLMFCYSPGVNVSPFPKSQLSLLWQDSYFQRSLANHSHMCLHWRGDKRQSYLYQKSVLKYDPVY